MFRYLATLSLLMWLSTFVALAQSEDNQSHSATFLIESTDSNVVVDATFNESLRRALFDYFPQLDTARTEQSLNEGLRRYVKSSLQLIDGTQDKALKLLKVRALPDSSSVDASRYMFVFETGTVSQMRNMLLFNLYKKQENHNVFLMDGQRYEFVTTSLSPVATISFSEQPKTEGIGMDSRWTVWILAIAGLLVVWMILKRKNENTRRQRRGR